MSAHFLGIACSPELCTTAGAHVALKVYYIPFVLQQPAEIKLLWTYNGGVINGNVDIGIFDDVGTKIVSSGSTLLAGANAIQTFNIADTLIGPGNFYLGFVTSSASATFYRYSWNNILFIITAGVLHETIGALPLPATATFAQPTTSLLVPLIGFSTVSVM
jgi:hypothetical protein